MPETTSAALSKIATEALKPVSSVIDALLGPKLQRIRNWSEQQDLDSRLGSGAIDVLLDQYIRRLLRRICGITTIVFPQQSLPLTSIYEPLILREKYPQKGAKRPRHFNVSDLKKGYNYYVVDSAGMGKSTFAKHLVLEILNATTKIPIFLELRRISANESLLGRLALEIDETGKDVDERLLPLLLGESEFVLILDGYDEVSEQTRKSLGEQITQLAVQCENLQVIVTARPEVSLPELPDSIPLTIDPLTKAKAESLVLRYDALAKIDVGKRLAAQFDVVSEQFLTTPLLVVLLYRTYGFNQSIATRITSFYDEVFNALYKGHDLSKAGFAREKASRLDSEDFRRLLRGFSFLLAARQKDNLKSRTEGVTIVEEAIRLTSVQPASPSAFFDDLLLAVPLLVKEGTEYRFIHKSIGEFFAAEFLSYQTSPGQIIKHIREGNLYASFINPFQYLSEINPSVFRRFIVEPVAKDIIETPISNSHIRAMRFLSPTALGLWPLDNYAPYGSGKGRKHIDHPDDFSCSSWITVKLKGRRYTLGISFKCNHTKLPKAVLEAITEKVQYDEDSDVLNVDHLENALNLEQWIPIDDERVMGIAEHPAITLALIRANDFAVTELLGEDEFGEYADDYDDEFDGDLEGYDDEEGGGDESYEEEDNDDGEGEESAVFRIVSVAACEKLLNQINQEDETQGWLETLVSGKSTLMPPRE